MKKYFLVLIVFITSNLYAGELTCTAYSYKYALTGEDAVPSHKLEYLQRKIFVGSVNKFRHGKMVNIDLEKELFAVDGNEFDIEFRGESVKWKYLGFNPVTKEHRQYIQSYNSGEKTHMFTSYPNNNSYQPDSKSVVFKSNCK